MSLCVCAAVYLLPLPALYHPGTFQSMTSSLFPNQGLCLHWASLLCLISASLFLFLHFKMLDIASESEARTEKSEHVKDPQFSAIRSFSAHAGHSAAFSQGRRPPLEYFRSVKCHIHVFGPSVSPPERLTLLRWRVMIFPIKHYPSEEGTQHHLLNSSQRKHTHKHTPV